MSVPKLRFPEFNAEWEDKKLGELTYSISSGKTRNKSKNKSGKYKIYGSVGVIGYTDEPDYEGKCVLIARVGANAGKTNLIDAKCGVSDNTLIVKYKPELNAEFSYYHFEDYNLNKLIYGSGQPLITGKQLKNIQLKIPKYDEQRKIASFLLKVDEKIEKLEKKQELWDTYKKGIMQQIFSQKLRFKYENGEDYPNWEEKKLNELVNRITRKNKNLETDLPLTISAQHGLIDQISFFNKIVASKSLKGYYLIKKGEFAYNKSYSNGYPWGVIKRLDKYDQGALSTLYICFSLKKDVNSDFLVQYFSTNNWYREIYNIAIEGARNHGLLNISVNDFFSTNHKIPSLAEQIKIANFLCAIDSRINELNNELNINREFKKGLLQQMFC